MPWYPKRFTRAITYIDDRDRRFIVVPNELVDELAQRIAYALDPDASNVDQDVRDISAAIRDFAI